MSKTGEALREIGIVNTWDILKCFATKGVDDIGIGYKPSWGRSPIPSRTQIFSPYRKTDPKAHWSDHDQKTFTGDRKSSLPKAIEWAKEQYKIEEFVTCPADGGRGDYIPKTVKDRAMAALKEHLQRKKDGQQPT